MGPLGPLRRWLACNARRAIHHALTAIIRVERPTNRTFVLLQYTDDQPDKLFVYTGVLRNEALHNRLDLLIDEHLDETLCRTIWVVTYDSHGEPTEEEIPFQLADY